MEKLASHWRTELHRRQNRRCVVGPSASWASKPPRGNFAFLFSSCENFLLSLPLVPRICYRKLRCGANESRRATCLTPILMPICARRHGDERWQASHGIHRPKPEKGGSARRRHSRRLPLSLSCGARAEWFRVGLRYM